MERFLRKCQTSKVFNHRNLDCVNWLLSPISSNFLVAEKKIMLKKKLRKIPLYSLAFQSWKWFKCLHCLFFIHQLVLLVQLIMFQILECSTFYFNAHIKPRKRHFFLNISHTSRSSMMMFTCSWSQMSIMFYNFIEE